MVYSHTMEYYSVIKSNEAQYIHTTTWMNFKNITLSEGSRSQKTTICFHLHELSRIGKFSETEKSVSVCQD